MFCINEDCEWHGELGSHQIAMVGTVKRCGLCMQPVVDKLERTSSSVSVPAFDPKKTEATFDGDLSEAAQRAELGEPITVSAEALQSVVRRDIDAEGQAELAEQAEAEDGAAPLVDGLKAAGVDWPEDAVPLVPVTGEELDKVGAQFELPRGEGESDAVYRDRLEAQALAQLREEAKK